MVRADPIFVVGAGRSGTALLQSLIGSHPRIAAPPEMHYLTRIAMLEKYWGDLGDDDVLRRVVEATVSPPHLSKCGFDVDRIVEAARAGPRTYAGVLDAVMRDFMVREGKARWSEKTPLQPNFMIWEHFPNAQVVHIVRDPFDSIASNLQKTGVWREPTSAAWHWRRFTKRNMRYGAERGADYYLRIRFEDLVHDPESTMRQVCAFLDEEYDPRMVSDPELRRGTIRTENNPINKRVLGPIDAAAVGVSRTSLKRSAQWRIASRVAPILPSLGYPKPPFSSVAMGRLFNAAVWPVMGPRVLWIQMSLRFRSPEKRFDATRKIQSRQFDRRQSRTTD